MMAAKGKSDSFQVAASVSSGLNATAAATVDGWVGSFQATC